MLVWRFGKRQSGEFCIGCYWIPCYCIRYRNAAITEHGSLSRDAIVLFIAYRSSIPPQSTLIPSLYKRLSPWGQTRKLVKFCSYSSRAAKTIHCAQNVKTVRLCTEFSKSINNIFLICHILWYFQDGHH